MVGASFRKVVFGGATFAAVAFVAGGGYLLTAANAVDTRQGNAAAPPSLENHDPEVRGELLSLFFGSATRYAAQEELVRRCMERRGFAYVKNPVSTVDVAPTLGRDPYDLTVEDAKTSGYNSAENAGDSPVETDRSGVSKLRVEGQKLWGEAYFGSESAPEITVKLPDGGTVGTTGEGCLAESKNKLYGSLSDYAKLTFLSGNIPIWARLEASSDTDMSHIDSAWSTCMASKGYAGLKDPEAARGRAMGAHRQLGIGSNKARDQEISLAIADAECEKMTGYAAQRIAIEDRYYRKLLRKYATEVADAKEMNDPALARAREVLGTR